MASPRKQPSQSHDNYTKLWFRTQAGTEHGWGCTIFKIVKLASLLTTLLFININLTKLQKCLFRATIETGQKVDFLVEATQCRYSIIDSALPVELTICPPNNSLGIVSFLHLDLQNATLIGLAGPRLAAFAEWGSRCFHSFPPARHCLLYNRYPLSSASNSTQFPANYSCTTFAKFDNSTLLCNPLKKQWRILSVNGFPFSTTETTAIFKEVARTIQPHSIPLAKIIRT